MNKAQMVSAIGVFVMMGMAGGACTVEEDGGTTGVASYAGGPRPIPPTTPMCPKDLSAPKDLSGGDGGGGGGDGGAPNLPCCDHSSGTIPFFTCTLGQAPRPYCTIYDYGWIGQLGPNPGNTLTGNNQGSACCITGSEFSNEQVFEFQPMMSGTMTLHLISPVNLGLSVNAGCHGTIACVDDAPAGAPEHVTFDIYDDDRLEIVVDGVNGEAGPFTLFIMMP